MMAAARYVLPALFMILPCLPAQAIENSHFEFSGEVVRGQEYYSHALPDGLTFFLMPTAAGWQIRVQKTPYESKLLKLSNLADITPPLHGPNPTEIEGWHFRNSDNTRPNEPGDKNLNFPQEDREFEFALSENDHQSIWSYYNCAAEAKNLCLPYTPELLGHATLHITDYKLGNLKPNQRAWFESMKFTVAGDYSPSQDDVHKIHQGNGQ